MDAACDNASKGKATVTMHHSESQPYPWLHEASHVLDANEVGPCGRDSRCKFGVVLNSVNLFVRTAEVSSVADTDLGDLV